MSKSNTTKKFEIELYDEVLVGDNVQYEKIHYDKPIYIEASSKAELDEHAARFRLINQKMKIIRVMDVDEKPVDIKDNNVANQQHITTQKKSENTTDVAIVDNNTNTEEYPIQVITKEKPKFYRVGNIEIKNDNGKIYQKQWIRLSDVDASNIRVVSDKNNSIVNLNGKHFEVLRWINIEQQENISDISDILN